MPARASQTVSPGHSFELTADAFPRSKTIAFDDADDGMDHDHHGQTTAREANFPRTVTNRSTERFPPTGTMQSFPRTYTLRPTSSRKPASKLTDYGGFPTPIDIVRHFIKKVAPDASRRLSGSFSMPRTNTIGGRGTIAPDEYDRGVKEVPYITFTAKVGRNSHFHELTSEQMDELGGVEYRALRVLLYIVAAVSLCRKRWLNRSISSVSRCSPLSSLLLISPLEGDMTMFSLRSRNTSPLGGSACSRCSPRFPTPA